MRKRSLGGSARRKDCFFAADVHIRSLPAKPSNCIKELSLSGVSLSHKEGPDRRQGWQGNSPERPAAGRLAHHVLVHDPAALPSQLGPCFSLWLEIPCLLRGACTQASTGMMLRLHNPGDCCTKPPCFRQISSKQVEKQSPYHRAPASSVACLWPAWPAHVRQRPAPRQAVALYAGREALHMVGSPQPGIDEMLSMCDANNHAHQRSARHPSRQQQCTS